MNKLGSFLLSAWNRNNKELYHGTPTKENADKIIQEGLKPLYDYNPVVSMTDDIKVACDFADIEHPSQSLLGNFCYVFVIEQSKFNSLPAYEPLMEQLMYCTRHGTTNIAPYGKDIMNKILSNITKGEAKYFWNNSVEDIPKDVYYKIINEILTPEELEILAIVVGDDLGENEYSYPGVVVPKECWQFDRKLSRRLNNDCSNFFELATLYWRR